jgi:hypothetical protein
MDMLSGLGQNALDTGRPKAFIEQHVMMAFMTMLM